MKREFKHLPFFEVKAQSDNPRVKSGICSVFGHIDDWGDRVHPGAFQKTISEGRNRAKHLWNHDFSQPPIASIKELREVGIAELKELAPQIFDFAPDATGGLLVTREYYTDEFSDRIYKAIEAGDVNEMSFGFDVVRYEITKEGEGVNEKSIRELHELRLFDTSDVLWGMNNATLAALKSGMELQPLGLLAEQIKMHIAEFKSGRRNSTADQSMINAIHDYAKELGAICATETEDEKKNAEAAKSTSLSELTQRFQKLQIENLKL